MNIGKTRNPIVSLLIYVVGAGILPLIPLIQLWIMIGELKAFTGDESVAQWKLFIPILNLIFLFSTLPTAMGKAFQKAGVQGKTPSGGFIYFLLPAFALAGDLNEVWEGARRSMPAGAGVPA